MQEQNGGKILRSVSFVLFFEKSNFFFRLLVVFNSKDPRLPPHPSSCLPVLQALHETCTLIFFFLQPPELDTQRRAPSVNSPPITFCFFSTFFFHCPPLSSTFQ